MIDRFIRRVLSSSLILVTIPFLATQNAFAGFPTSSGGGSYCFYNCSPTTSTDSTLVLNFNPDNDDGNAPVQINFFPYPDTPDLGDLCWSGKVKGTIYNHVSTTYPSTGTATYDILSASDDPALDNLNKGMCYSNVVRSIKPGSVGTLGDCEYRTYHYNLVLHDADFSSGGVYDNTALADLLNGRFKVDTTLATEGAYDECRDWASCIATATNPASCGSEPKICNIETGFGVNNNTPVFIGFENLFPADITLSGEPTAAGQAYFSDEVLVECDPASVGVDTDSTALGAKSTKIYMSESMSMFANWCTNSYSADPDCNAFNLAGERATGHVSTAIGDYQTQNAEVTCINSMEDLRNLSSCSTELALATCAGSVDGFMQFPDSFEGDSCLDGDNNTHEVETFFFSSAQGGGSSTANVIAIGATADSPGYVGDNTLPPILPGWTAIVSTPDNQPNTWDLSGLETVQVAYIHVRNNDDWVLGTLKADNIFGGSGADYVNGSDGNDVVQGGDNTDELEGGDGNDLILGYECNSVNGTCGTFLNNGSDDDILIGGSGSDCLDGGRGNDTYTGGAGADFHVLFGNTDNDFVTDFSVADGDKVVDMTGSASIKWVKGSKKDAIPSVCEVTTSGNDVMTIEGPDIGQSTCNSGIIIDVTADYSNMPASCMGHPYSWPNNR
jgi:Ca2+-binding RTX toxin-like protein